MRVVLGRRMGLEKMKCEASGSHCGCQLVVGLW